MAATVPPTQNSSIFNNDFYTESANASLTVAKGDLRYLKYPNAQGPQSMQDLTVNGKMVCNNSATFTQPPRQQLNSNRTWQSTTGPLALAKSYQPIVNPLVTGSKALLSNTFQFGTGGTINFPESGIVYDAKRQQFACCAFSGGGSSNQVKVSTNGGLTWTDRPYTAATTQPDWCIFYFESIDTYLFTLVSSNVTNGRVMISTDGCQTFTLYNTPSNNLSYRGAAYSPELNVMVMCCVAANQTTSNGICYSLDKGLTWNDAAVPAVASRIQVRWVPELKRFFTTHLNGYVLYSDDGINWFSTTTYQDAAPFQSSSILAWSSQLGMMVSRAANNVSSTLILSCSYDGLNWFYANNTSFFPGSPADLQFISQLGLFVGCFASGTGNRLCYSGDGLSWFVQATPADLFYRSIAYSPQYAVLCVVASQPNDSSGRGLVTSFANRLPTSWNTFDSSYNRIDASGNWMFKTNNLYTDSAQTIHVKSALELDGTSGTDRQVYTSYVNYRNQNDNAACTQQYASVGNMIYDNNTNGGSHIFNVNDSSGNEISVITANASRITTREPTFQQLSNSTSVFNKTNGFLGMAKDAAVAVNPTSAAAIAAVSTWQLRNTPLTDSQNRSICWSSQLGLFCCVSSAGPANTRVMTSLDSINWTYRTTPDLAWTSVCYADGLGLFVAVSESGTGNRVMTGDGITWTSRTSAADEFWTSIAYSTELNLLVAVASTGASNIMTSSDGITWTLRTPPSTVALNAVIWCPNLALFVTVGNGGGFISRDGITWVSISVPSRPWASLAYSNITNTIIATATGGVNRFMYSTDGFAWQLAPTPASDFTWFSSCYSPSLQLFLAAATPSGVPNSFATSPDGLTWTLRNASSNGIQVWSVCWSPELGIFAGCGFSGASGQRIITSSFQHRVPTQLNVFASPSNTISQAGDWSIQGTSFQSANAVTLGSTAGNTTIQTGATLRFNASTAATAGGGSGVYLNINVNGTAYKIALLNV